MSLWLGVLGSSLLAGGDFEAIATVNVGSGGASSIEFTSIPSTFAHLQVRLLARSSYSQNEDSPGVRFNSDTGSNYAFHYLLGNESSAVAGGDPNRTSANLIQHVAGNTAPSNVFGATVIDILDYSDTSKNTTLRSIGGRDDNGSGVSAIGSGFWNDTSAVTSILIYAAGVSGNDWLEHTTAALYGIKAP